MLDVYIGIKLHQLVNKPKNKNTYVISVQSYPNNRYNRTAISVIHNIISVIHNNICTFAP
jgi:hypothetical protein